MEATPKMGASAEPGGQVPPTPAWTGAASFRETMLAFLDDPAARDTLRAAGGVIYDLALQAAVGTGEPASATRRDVQAGQADLRYLRGWFESISRAEEESELTAEDAALARFAGRMAGELAKLDAAIEKELA